MYYENMKRVVVEAWTILCPNLYFGGIDPIMYYEQTIIYTWRFTYAIRPDLHLQKKPGPAVCQYWRNHLLFSACGGDKKYMTMEIPSRFRLNILVFCLVFFCFVLFLLFTGNTLYAILYSFSQNLLRKIF